MMLPYKSLLPLLCPKATNLNICTRAKLFSASLAVPSNTPHDHPHPQHAPPSLFQPIRPAFATVIACERMSDFSDRSRRDQFIREENLINTINKHPIIGLLVPDLQNATNLVLKKVPLLWHWFDILQLWLFRGNYHDTSCFLCENSRLEVLLSWTKLFF